MARHGFGAGAVGMLLGLAMYLTLNILLTDGPAKMQPDAAADAQATLAAMKKRFGYCESCAKDAVLALIRKRYS